MAKKMKKQSSKMAQAAPAYPALPPKHQDPYEVESAGRKLMGAQQVKADKKLHASAKKHLMKLSARAKKAASDNDGDEN